MKQDPNPSIRGVGAPMDGLSALPWTARWCQGTLPCPPCPQSVDKRCRRSHGRVERLAMDGPLVSRYLTLPCETHSDCFVRCASARLKDWSFEPRLSM